MWYRFFLIFRSASTHFCMCCRGWMTKISIFSPLPMTSIQNSIYEVICCVLDLKGLLNSIQNDEYVRIKGVESLSGQNQQRKVKILKLIWTDLGEVSPHLRFWSYGQPGHCRPRGRWVGWTASTRWSLPHVLEPPSRYYGDPESVLRLWGVASPEQQEG